MAIYLTEVRESNPAKEEEELKRYAGPEINASSFEDAVEKARISAPYAKVIGRKGYPDVSNRPSFRHG